MFLKLTQIVLNRQETSSPLAARENTIVGQHIATTISEDQVDTARRVVAVESGARVFLYNNAPD
jgi:hypothetical protein